MLIEFRVANFRSIREEQILSLEAGGVGKANSPPAREIPGHKKGILPVAAIYGANASGKSNVLAALAFMSDAIAYSQRAWAPESGVPRAPFAWGPSRKEPSLFELTFLLDSVKYQYGFAVNDQEVVDEWLYAWPKGRKQTWFTREQAKIKPSHDHLHGPNESVREVTRDNALFLSAAALLNHPQLLPLYHWFRRINPGVSPTRRPPLYRRRPRFLPHYRDDFDLRTKQLLHSADTGIIDIRRRTPDGDAAPYEVLELQHSENDESSWLRIEEESQGTQTLLRLAPLLFRSIDTRSVLLIDELEASLHPLIGLRIIEMFNSAKSNPQNSQLIFTTHDTNLLGQITESPLRRDQVWFTEKNQEGATHLYPLTDYKARKQENLERGYLQGRYGAIPFLDDFNLAGE